MKRIIILLILCFSFGESFSQRNIIEISHYIFPDFTEGTVQMKDGQKDVLLLNYNTITEEMLFKSSGKILAIGKNEIGLVDNVTINDRKFVVVNNKFVEVLYHAFIDFYVEHRCSVIPPGKPAAYGGTSQTSSADSYSSFSSNGIYHDLKLPDGYTTKPYVYYWIKKDGKLNKILNLKQLMRFYDSKRDLFKNYVDKYNVRYEDTESVAKLVEYLEKA